MSDQPEHRARCLCGAIRIRTTGAPAWIATCHCETCRRATGGTIATFAGFSPAAVAIEAGAPRYYASSEGVRRGFCPDCGTSLTYESTRWPDEIHLIATNFDRPEAFAPQLHVFTGERLPWLHLADGLPTYRTVPSADETTTD